MYRIIIEWVQWVYTRNQSMNMHGNETAALVTELSNCNNISNYNPAFINYSPKELQNNYTDHTIHPLSITLRHPHLIPPPSDPRKVTTP